MQGRTESPMSSIAQGNALGVLQTTMTPCKGKSLIIKYFENFCFYKALAFLYKNTLSGCLTKDVFRPCFRIVKPE